MTKQRKRVRNATPSDTADYTAAATAPMTSSCVLCDDAASTSCLLRCNACDGVYHPFCANISTDVFRVLQPILPSVGWVCQGCISAIREKRKSTDDQLQSLSTALHKLEDEHRSLVQKVDSIITSRSSTASADLPTDLFCFLYC